MQASTQIIAKQTQVDQIELEGDPVEIPKKRPKEKKKNCIELQKNRPILLEDRKRLRNK